MKIIWITTQFPSHENDTKGAFIVRTVRELRKNYDIQIICLHSIVPPIIPMLKNVNHAKKIYRVWRIKYPKNPQAPSDLKDVVRYAKYIRLPRGLFHFIEGWFGYQAVKKYIKDINQNDTCIHATWLFPEGDTAYRISKKFNLPYIVTLMGSDVHFLVKNSIKWHKAKEIISKSRFITSVSKQLYIDIEKKELKIPIEKKALTHTIYEFDKFIILNKQETRKDLFIEQSMKLIFYAGTLRKIKNVDILILAFHELFKKRNDIKLLIAGQGEEEGKLKELVKTNNLSNSIHFLGGLNGEEIIKYYNATDIFVLPSQNEGLPNVVVESLLCGTPVVASAVGEIPYLIKNGENGYLVEANNTQELADRLDNALNEEWDREKIRNSMQFLSPKSVIREYEFIYNSL